MSGSVQFQEERRSGIGGSDIAALFNEGYGCTRRLWYDKVGVPADFTFKETAPIRLGRLLESYFAEEYAKATGRVVREVEFLRDAEDPALVVHIDREIVDQEKGIGVLEIKSVGNWVYTSVKRYGLIPDYYLQVQHGMLVHNRRWGGFCIGNRNNGEFLKWDVERDELVIARIREEGPKFWERVTRGQFVRLVGDEKEAEEYAPERLDPSDRRCQSCAWRLTCHQAEMPQERSDAIEEADDLRPLRAEYIDRRELRNEAQNLLDEKSEELKAALGDRTAVKIAGKNTYYRWHEKHPVDVTGLTERYEALRAKFLKPRSKLQKAFPPAATFTRTVPERTLRVY